LKAYQTSSHNGTLEILSNKQNLLHYFLQYSGTNAEFTKADAVIFRTDIYNMTSGRKEHNFKRTLKYDSKWLDSEYRFYDFIAFSK
jgi:hypothetical protein